MILLPIRVLPGDAIFEIFESTKTRELFVQSAEDKFQIFAHIQVRILTVIFGGRGNTIKHFSSFIFPSQFGIWGSPLLPPPSRGGGATMLAHKRATIGSHWGSNGAANPDILVQLKMLKIVLYCSVSHNVHEGEDFP